MKAEELEALFRNHPILEDMRCGKEIIWINPDHTDFATGMEGSELTMADV